MNLINPYNYVKTPFPRFDSSCLFDKSATDFYLELSLSVRACVRVCACARSCERILNKIA